MIDIQIQTGFQENQFAMTVNFSLNSKDRLAIFGASASGKTTLLRCLAGLHKPQIGNIIVHGQCWLDSARKICLPTARRQLGYMFQDYALFPHWSVIEQLRFACKDEVSIAWLLAELDLQDVRHKKPSQLSGGQQQRTALARALVTSPPLLLLDEPFSALDGGLRAKIRGLLLAWQQRHAATLIFVSHDKADVVGLATQVLLLEAGQVLKFGTPEQVFAPSSTLHSTVLSSTPLLVDVPAQVLAVEDKNSLTQQVGDILPLRVAMIKSNDETFAR